VVKRSFWNFFGKPTQKEINTPSSAPSTQDQAEKGRLRTQIQGQKIIASFVPSWWGYDTSNPKLVVLVPKKDHPSTQLAMDSLTQRITAIKERMGQLRQNEISAVEAVLEGYRAQLTALNESIRDYLPIYSLTHQMFLLKNIFSFLFNPDELALMSRFATAFPLVTATAGLVVGSSNGQTQPASAQVGVAAADGIGSSSKKAMFS